MPKRDHIDPNWNESETSKIIFQYILPHICPIWCLPRPNSGHMWHPCSCPLINPCCSSEYTDSGPRWVWLTPNGTNPRLFTSDFSIFCHLAKMYWNVICPRFVPFGANLTHFGIKSELVVVDPLVTVISHISCLLSLCTKHWHYDVSTI